jgi:hypothetical protein
MRADRRTLVTKLIVYFLNSANAPTISSRQCYRSIHELWAKHTSLPSQLLSSAQFDWLEWIWFGQYANRLPTVLSCHAQFEFPLEGEERVCVRACVCARALHKRSRNYYSNNYKVPSTMPLAYPLTEAALCILGMTNGPPLRTDSRPK